VAPEGSIDKIVVNEIYRVIVGKAGQPDQFPYINCWHDTILSRPTWLTPCLEETCRIMVARMAATSKCREKSKEPLLAEEPEEMPLPHVPLYPPLPGTQFCTFTFDVEWGSLRDSHTCKIWPGGL
jgi:hypothetical protein